MTKEAKRTAEIGGGRLATSIRVLQLATKAAPRPTLVLAICTLAVGALPALAAWVGKWIVDTVVIAAALEDGWGEYKRTLWALVALEGVVIGLFVSAQRAQAAAQAILKTRLSNRVTEMIVEKASTLELAHFEDPEVHDRLLRARREAGIRPYNLVAGLFVVARNAVTLATSIVVLLGLSWWAVLIVVLAGLPAFIAELSFSQQVFDQQRKRTPEQREQAYLEAVLSREDFAKEVKVYELAAPLLERFRAIAARIEREERTITLQRNFWGTLFSLIGTAAFYMAYAWIVHRTVNDHLTLGQMTMYLVIFRQAQQGVTAGLASLGLMLDDHLYLRDLESFVALPVAQAGGTATEGPDPSAGLEVRNLSFTYPGAPHPTLENVSFTIRPGELVAMVGQNGSGKTTLIKLITRLYDVPRGTVFLDGLDVCDWDVHALRRRFSLVFQDFVRFRMKAGENIGAGDVERWQDEARWRDAAELGLAHEFLSELPDGYHTQLGKWFKGGQELSGGQWQKVALSRAFMRADDAIMILDEPTSALDPDAEVKIFEHVQATRGRRMVLLISHRFGSVRIADRIVVLDDGRVVEQGQHRDLMANEGLYARLFNLQAAGYLGTRASEPPAIAAKKRKAEL